MQYPRIRTAVFDIETDGLLHQLKTIHILVIRDFERRITYVFRRNEHEDTIDTGLDLLEDAERAVGINNIYFDTPALDKVYEGIDYRGEEFDCMVMSRMCFANQKEKDFRLWEKGQLPGKLIGRHTLEAWGYRMGQHKGDYNEDKLKEAEALGITDPEELRIFVWGAWNQEMEDYCVNDVEVTTMLWSRIKATNWAQGAIDLEHSIHRLMGRQQDNGIYFNVPEAEKLAVELEGEAKKFEDNLISFYGNWWMPQKKRIVKMQWDDPDGVNKKKKYDPLGPGETTRRAVWAEVTTPKRNVNYADVLRGSYSADAPYCKIKLCEFNPNSRVQIIDRFATIHNWHPVDFTEKGSPKVSDDILRKLIGGPITMAEPLAELFYYKKRLGQLKTGENAWLRKVEPDGKIHAYVNVGGTISGRASHVSPNLGQVPKVKFVKALDKDGNVVLKDNGKPKEIIGKGRVGDHGFECRHLFYVPEPWQMVGIDMAGIELRCFGEKLSKYDNGAYLELVLSGDPHSYNQRLAELPTRDNAKTFIYALLYGAGDVKLGSIVAPFEDEDTQRAIGARLRERFMSGLPAYANLVKEIKRYAKAGWIPGLDGRKLFVRSPHSALNTWLQSDAALMSKKWLCLTEERMIAKGLMQGWNGDFVQLLWIHDESQYAVKPEYTEILKETSISAARDTGLFFNYKCPIAVEPKVGMNWAECH